MSAGHGRLISRLDHLLQRQLDWDADEVRVNHGRLRGGEQTACIPDLVGVPAAMSRALLDDPRALDRYAEPLPLVVEVWSPSTGGYDVDEKPPEYRRRGDAEIWRLHPFERTLTVWRRREDGTYEEATLREGTVRPVALPHVTIDLGLLFGG